ncbi:hypothetical protein AV654_32880 [Paenibacillus elgii]|uniref:Uncharacterized protein n=1 Tax=Paenibacillus elgii TaxID=189691 RepID=A0A163UCC6_9BACL|nr:hypothetical protein AV654_32880 [Paenibacillus elgii]
MGKSGKIKDTLGLPTVSDMTAELTVAMKNFVSTLSDKIRNSGRKPAIKVIEQAKESTAARTSRQSLAG